MRPPSRTEGANPTSWAILTGEYPPQPGGVADYTHLVALGLAAAGDEVTVFAPALKAGRDLENPGICVARLPDHFGPRGLAVMGQSFRRRAPDRVLVQYVPHAFGYKAMNVPFALWVALRARHVAPVWVMFHEVAFPLGRSAKHLALGLTTRLMARLVAGAAERVFCSIPAWASMLRRICPGSVAAEWLPVPCNVSTAVDEVAVQAVRARYSSGGNALVGHFGTYGDLITRFLRPTLIQLLEKSSTTRLLLIGRGSSRFLDELVQVAPDVAARASASGDLSPNEVAAHLRACDLLVQPYGDGVSARRGSVMAGLANGVPVVTNLGHLSEPLWRTSPVVALAATPDPGEIAAVARRVLALSPAERAAMGASAAELYLRLFSLEHTLARLRAPSA